MRLLECDFGTGVVFVSQLVYSVCIAVFPVLADVVEVKKGSGSTAHWSVHFIRLNGWLRHSFTHLITPLDIDHVGQNWADSNTSGMYLFLCHRAVVLLFFAHSRVLATLHCLSSVDFPRLPRTIASTSSPASYLLLFLFLSGCTPHGTLHVHGVLNGMQVVLQSQSALHHQLLLGRVCLTKALLSDITGAIIQTISHTSSSIPRDEAR